MMVPRLKQPIARLTTWAARMRFYGIAIILVAASVPFLHLYMDDRLSLAEMVVHTLSVTLSTVIAIALFELVLWVYLKGKIGGWSVSIGLFWLVLFGVFTLSFVVMSATHDFLPITLDIWNKHIERDLWAAPWKMLPIVLLIGYILIQIIRRYQLAQELATLKKFNEQLQIVRSGVESSGDDAKESPCLGVPKLVLPHKGGDLHLTPAWVVRVESNENYCHVLVAENENQSGRCYMVRITLNEVLNQLPEDLFLQVHRSHIINFSYVSSVVRQGRNYLLRLTNGDHVPVSRSRAAQIRQRAQQTLGKT